MRFVDLFAGLGGFHVALNRLGCECVFASEINQCLREVYNKNFGIMPAGDIKQVDISSIPEHDILCAGFPCQPFSKAGDQNGFDCPRSGDLFGYVHEVLRYHQPKYLILENVPNLLKHNKGETWREIRETLKSIGYNIKEKRLSPHQFGVPQIRERVYIVGSLADLDQFNWPDCEKAIPSSIYSVLEHNPEVSKPLSKQVVQCLEAWQNFIRLFPQDVELPSFPIWSMEFGATYPYEETTPYAIGIDRLKNFCGSHGKDLSIVDAVDRLTYLPSYARGHEASFPKWKIQFIKQNREFYSKYKNIIDEWLPSILQFPASLQKLEWNCKGEIRNIWKFIIQFRASGVRVKRPTTTPSLVAMTTTQVPIIGWERRYMTPKECANLQSLGSLEFLPSSDNSAFKALGNAVNADIVHRIALQLISM